MDNCRISCQIMADMKKKYDDLIIINLYATAILLDVLSDFLIFCIIGLKVGTDMEVTTTK